VKRRLWGKVVCMDSLPHSWQPSGLPPPQLPSRKERAEEAGRPSKSSAASPPHPPVTHSQGLSHQAGAPLPPSCQRGVVSLIQSSQCFMEYSVPVQGLPARVHLIVVCASAEKPISRRGGIMLWNHGRAKCVREVKSKDTQHTFAPPPPSPLPLSPTSP
jgi:hypothetical protein